MIDENGPPPPPVDDEAGTEIEVDTEVGDDGGVDAEVDVEVDADGTEDEDGADAAPAEPSTDAVAVAAAEAVIEAAAEPEAGIDTDADAASPEADALPLDAVVEALLFAAREPLTAAQIARAVRKGQRREEVVEAIGRLNEFYLAAERAFEITVVAEKYQLYSRPEYAAHLRTLFPATAAGAEEKDRRLSPAALDTLSIVAYKQPVTRAEVKEVRGVESDNIIRTLLERGLVKVTGRRLDVVGQPVLYGTTERFLEEFGLSDLEGLPFLGEMRRQLGLGEPLPAPLPAPATVADPDAAVPSGSQEADAADAAADDEDAAEDDEKAAVDDFDDDGESPADEVPDAITDTPADDSDDIDEFPDDDAFAIDDDDDEEEEDIGDADDGDYDEFDDDDDDDDDYE